MWGIEKEGGGGDILDRGRKGGVFPEDIIEFTSLFLAKHMRHFPPKKGCCSDSRHLPQSVQKILSKLFEKITGLKIKMFGCSNSWIALVSIT